MKIVKLLLTPNSRRRLLEKVFPRFSAEKGDRILANHVTLAHNPTPQQMLQFGWETWIGRHIKIATLMDCFDDSAQAVSVLWIEQDIRCLNKIPHITIATYSGVQSVYSNKLLEHPDNQIMMGGMVLDTHLTIEEQ